MINDHSYFLITINPGPALVHMTELKNYWKYC